MQKKNSNRMDRVNEELKKAGLPEFGVVQLYNKSKNIT